ncbi:MAG TPA: hypothetical protein VGK20_02160 [Candidatus Binatia bacterium]|jgi:hypothetical protein
MKKLLFIAVLFAFPSVPGRALAVDAAAVDKCRHELFAGLEASSSGHVGELAQCLLAGKYDGSCPFDDLHTGFDDNELIHQIAGPASACQAALASGATIADFGPASCANEWGDCDTAVPSIATLDDLAQCFVCQVRGHDAALRSVLGIPRPAPTDKDERHCTHRIALLVAGTARRAFYDADTCSAGLTKPYSCPFSTAATSHFGRALASFTPRIAACGIDDGKSPGVLANICGGTATNAAELTTCLESLTRCLACRSLDSALGQSDDCAVTSGYADCDGMF